MYTVQLTAFCESFNSCNTALLLIRFQYQWWRWSRLRLRRSWLSCSIAPCLLATFRRHSKKLSLRWLSRSLGLMPWMLSRIAQFLILLWCQNFLSGLWQGNSRATCSHLISYHLFSQVFDQATQQKLPSSVSCLIYWRQWTVETLLL